MTLITRLFTPPPFRTNPNLQHYCRVCNTQLNSCRQVNIHVGGKKHEKRFNFLKFSIESGMKLFSISFLLELRLIPSVFPLIFQAPETRRTSCSITRTQ